MKGYVALISAIIISAVLLMLVTTSNLSGLYGRFNMLDTELKARSRAAADACADLALLALREAKDPSGLTFTLNNLDRCRVGSLSGSGSEKTFTIQATSSNAITNLRLTVAASNFEILSREEISTF